MKINKNYPLLKNAFNKEDLDSAISVIRSKRITMSNVTYEFEKKFAKVLGAKYAVMTNSGSSANLLALSALTNPLNELKLEKGDEVIIPALCWSTSLWPIVLNNLKPIFVDVSIDTLNINLDELKKKITKKTKAIMCIHVLGTSTNMSKLVKIAKKNKIILIEDTCESLGAKYRNKNLGTFGKFGTYSFYHSHQITSGEGGMIVCNNKKDYHIVKTLRSHGWSRGTIFNNIYKKKYKKLDNRFMFVGPGFNLRPTEIQAAIANSQFNRLNRFMKIRNFNRNLIISKLLNNLKWSNQFSFINISKDIKPSWFGLPMLVNSRFSKIKKSFLNYLSSCGIENRPIISGNFLNQPAAKLYKFKFNLKDLKNSQSIEDRGFFIGLHAEKITKKEINYLLEKLFKIDDFI